MLCSYPQGAGGRVSPKNRLAAIAATSTSADSLEICAPATVSRMASLFTTLPELPVEFFGGATTEAVACAAFCASSFRFC